MSKCLVTGGRGFIGSHIVKRLLQETHEVEIIDDGSSPSVGPWYRTTVEFPYDISRDSTWTKLVGLDDYDVVFHTAAIARTPSCIQNPLRCHEVNATGALRIFVEYRDARVVHSSSNVVLGVPTPYRASKLAAEHYLEACNFLYGGNIIGLRYSNVIGPGLRKGDPAVLSALRDCRAEKGYIEITGDGEQTRNFTFVDDIVEANMIAAFGSNYKGIVDVSTGIVTSMNDFAKFFDCPVRHVGDRVGDSKHLYQSEKAAKEILGWEPMVPLEEAVRRSLV